jgi:hypothetical protein
MTLRLVPIDSIIEEQRRGGILPAAARLIARFGTRSRRKGFFC